MEAKKPRRRVADKARYQKNQAVKKKARNHREKLSVSRSARSYVRTQIEEFPKTYFDDQPLRSVLIVLHDNKDTDRILLQVNNIGKGNIYLSLPIMDERNLGTDAPKNSYEWVLAVRKYARATFGVEPRFAHDTGDYVLLTNSKYVERMSGFSPVTFCPSGRWHWSCVGDVAYLSGSSSYTYSGKQLKEFIHVHGDVRQIHLRHDTLEKIFNFRLQSGRLTEFHDDEPQEQKQGGEANE